jgi:glycosyltransferase involved in cell wall biosynthesis
MSKAGRLVSAIVPVYNGERFLADCLKSVLAQDYKPLEILVLDDGSTDATPQIAKSFGERIRYVRQKNAGEASARNKAVELAGGEFIAFLDADDLWYPGKISAQVSVMERYPDYGVVYGEFRRIDDAFRYEPGALATVDPAGEIDSVWSGWLYPRLLLDSWVHIITAMVRKEVFATVGAFDQDLCIGTDYDFWIRVSQKYRMAKIPQELSLYRDNPGSVTRKFHERNYAAEIVTKYVERFGLTGLGGDRVSPRELSRRLHITWVHHGYTALKNALFDDALASFVRAMKYHPYNVGIYKLILYASIGKLGSAIRGAGKEPPRTKSP